MFLSFPFDFSALLLSRNGVRLLFACLLSSRCASRGLCGCGTLAPFPPTDTKGGQNSPPSDYRQADQRTGYAAKADGLMSQSTRWRPRRFLVSRGSRWLPFCGDHQPYHCAFACLFHEGLPRLNAFLDGDLASEGWIAQLLPPFDSALLPHVACLYVG